MKPETFRERYNKLIHPWDKEDYTFRRVKAIMALPDPSQELDWFVQEVDMSLVRAVCHDLFIKKAPLPSIEALLDRWVQYQAVNKDPSGDLALVLYRSKRTVDISTWDRWLAKSHAVWGGPNNLPAQSSLRHTLSSFLVPTTHTAVQRQDWDFVRLLTKHFHCQEASLPRLCVGTPVFAHVLEHSNSLTALHDAAQRMISTELLETQDNQQDFQRLLDRLKKIGDPNVFEVLFHLAQAQNTLVYANMLQAQNPTIQVKDNPKLFETMLGQGNRRAFDLCPNLTLDKTVFKVMMKNILRYDVYSTGKHQKYSQDFIKDFHQRHQKCDYYASTIEEILNGTITYNLNKKTATVAHLKYMLEQVSDESKRALLVRAAHRGSLDLPRVILQHFTHIEPEVPHVEWRIKEAYEKLMVRTDRKALKEKTIKNIHQSPSSVKRKM